ncbi:autotransporter domain-containing protein [Aureimonas frigidaquae]|uniref:autotransporter domain-containing protein n=1 Tax=Aureimonas frigidaquae TaxID=424757 RepID=UPI0007808AFA|nr:autotransporter domain-containing protein [Aureimonas frigidaquae]
MIALKIRQCVFAALLASTALTWQPARAADASWTGAVSEDFSDAANWSPAAPTASDRAIIGATANEATIGTGLAATVSEILVEALGSGAKLWVNGSLVTSGSDAIGSAVGSKGTVFVHGSAGSWSATSNLIIGLSGNGGLYVSDGGTVSTAFTHLGRLTDGVGTATVTGPGSHWTATGSTNVGYDGYGAFYLENGARATFSALQVGMNAGAYGQVEVASGGTLELSGAGYIGNANGAAGIVKLSDDGSRLTSSAHLTVGLIGQGTVELSNGATAELSTLDIGRSLHSDGLVKVTTAAALTAGMTTVAYDAGSVGELSVTGAGSRAMINGPLLVGQGGSGFLTVDDSGVLTTTSLEGARSVGGRIDALVQGAGSLLKATDGAQLGTSGGSLQGQLVVQAGGSVETELSLAADGQVAISVDGAGSTLRVGTRHGAPADFSSADGWLSLSNARLDVSGGATVDADGIYVQGSPGGRSALLTADGGGTKLTAHLPFYVGGTGNGVGGNGEVYLTGGSILDGAVIAVGVDAGSSGFLLLQGAGTAAKTVPVGAFLGNVYAGSYGDGTIIVQDGASLTASNELRIGYAAGSTGTLIIGDEGSAAAAGTVSAGRGIAFGAGTGTLIFNHTGTDYRFANAIKGNGTILAQAGTTVMTGDLSGFTGTANIRAGAGLTFGDGGPTSFSGTIGNSGTLAFDTSSDTVFGGGITGSGGLVTSGTGRVTLSGPLSYTGLTRIQSGTLALTNEASITVLTGDIVDDSVLAITRTAQQDGIYPGRISGSGSLVKNGNGTLTLTGQNSYTGGTVVAAGTLVIGNGGSIEGDVVVNNGVLAFDRTGDITFGGGISGGGAMRLTGGATLTLTGDSTLVGGTTVEGSTLRIGDGGGRGSISSDIALLTGNTGPARLVLDRSDTVIMPSDFSGTGTIEQMGSGRVILTGDSSGFLGDMNLSAGALTVNGALGGTLRAMAGTSLSGSGTVGTLALRPGAMVAPGNSIGTLTVAGDYSQSAGSTYVVEFDPATAASDRIVVSGTALLEDGARLAPTPYTPGGLRAGTRYTILTAQNGVTGTFTVAPTPNSSLFYGLTPSYDANNAYLTVARLHSFESVGSTPNQMAVGAALDGLQEGAAATLGLAAAPSVEAARTVLDSLSGEVHAASGHAVARAGLSMASILRDHGRAQAASCLDAQGAPSCVDGTRPYLQALGTWTRLAGDGNAAGLSDTSTGVVVGLDRALPQDWTIGFALAQDSGGAALREGRGSLDTDSLGFGVYGAKRLGPVTVRVGGLVAHADIDTTRIAMAAEPETLTAQREALAMLGFAELRARMAPTTGFLADTVIEPFAALTVSQLHLGAASESIGYAALSVRESTDELAVAALGADVSHRVRLGTLPVALDLRLALEHRVGDRTPAAMVSFADGTPFAVSSTEQPQDSALFGLAARTSLSDALSIGLSYDGRFGDGMTEQSLRGDLAYRF